MDLVHLSTGDLLRAEIKAETELGLASQGIDGQRRTGRRTTS
jgi:adenylate kinase family enzyme